MRTIVTDIPKRDVAMVQCPRCGEMQGKSNFSYTKSFLFPNNRLPICNQCVKEILVAEDFSWDVVDKLCQYADIPFVPTEFEKLRALNGDDVFPFYAELFKDSSFEGLDWTDYYNEFKRLKEEKLIENELPEIREEKLRKLRKKWGANYDEEELRYLEDLYNGILATQSVNGALQIDQAEKLCKISLEIDSKIREGKDIDKILSSYDKLVKVAEFTPKNVKSASDFESVGELIKWLERRGWRNKYYDGVTRDIVDETIKNFQSYNRRLYTNESGIGEEITRRIEALKNARVLEQQNTDYYNTNQEYDLNEFEDKVFEDLENADFEIEEDGKENG